MNGYIVLGIFSIFLIIPFSLGIFYQESSHFLLSTPFNSNRTSKSYFGFSMGFQADSFSTLECVCSWCRWSCIRFVILCLFSINCLLLISPTILAVVGAPRHDFIGKVYTCPLLQLASRNVTCYEVSINMESMVKYTRETSPNQNFFFGSSIAATSNYFLTCAPLLTTSVNIKDENNVDAYGTCIIYNGTSYRYKGSLERFHKYPEARNKIYDTTLFLGGAGWTTLVDKTGNFLLIGKTSLYGDIQYVPLSDPSAVSKSAINEMNYDPLSKKWLQKKMQKSFNTGYGLASGKFFSHSTVYAFSMRTDKMAGEVAFLKVDPRFKKNKRMTLLMKTKTTPYLIKSYKKNRKLGSMFGSVLDAADINLDGYSELLVGAPAFYDEEKLEYGAVHIYIGGSLDMIDNENKTRTIIGTKIEARFGSAIATQDIDGDNIPEIFISAPYEDSGVGAVYILCGFDVIKELIEYPMYKEIQVSDLKSTQRIQAEGQRNFGFSLQILPDIDTSGCNNLAVGSPGSDVVLFYRCISNINVTVTAQIHGTQIIREQDNNFTVNVCVSVRYHPLLSDLSASNKIILVNKINGDNGASIPEPEFVIPLSNMSSLYCKNVNVILNNNDPAYYVFTAKVNLDYSEIQNSKNFNKRWVTLSPYSKTEATKEISRKCDGEDCRSKLSIRHITWSGETKYLLGSSETEIVNITIQNDGHYADQACVWIDIRGAKVGNVGCPEEKGRYKCELRKPFRRNTVQWVKIVLDMSKQKSTNTNSSVIVELQEWCNEVDHGIVIKKHLNINYTLDTSQVYVEGSSKARNVTDKQLVETGNSTINDRHQYSIINNGYVVWSLQAIIVIKKELFIKSYSTLSSNADKCVKKDEDDAISFSCDLTLMPNSTKKIIAAMEIAKDKFTSHLVDGKLNTTSRVTLMLNPTDEIKFESITTTFIYQKEFSFYNNQTLIISIATIVAFIILAIIIYILCRTNFFKRKQKQRLEVFRESVRRKSIKRNEPTDDNDNRNMPDRDECL